MKASRYSRYTTDDVGGAVSLPTQPASCSPVNPTVNSSVYHRNGSDEFDETEDEIELYAPPIAPSTKRSAIKSVTGKNQQLKAKRIAEARLARISEELSQLADTIRYLNPLVAEAIDDAWDANETAIEMLSNEAIWG